MRRSNVYLVRVLEGKIRENGVEKIFGEIIVEFFHN
jgi:hypothetical protein